MKITNHIKFLFLLLLTLLLGATTTHAKTELVLPLKQVVFSIEQTPKVNTLKKEVQPNVGFLSRKFSGEKTKFVAIEGISAVKTFAFAECVGGKLANGGGEIVRGVSKSVFKASFTASDEIAEQAWIFFKNEDWASLENLFNTHNLNKHNGLVFPPNNGAVNVIKKTLDPTDFNNNLIIDRYGSTTGKYTAPANTPFNQRSLPSSYATQSPQKYKVIKPIPNVEEGQIIPWFNQPGLGTQYKLENSVQYYINEGYLIPIP